MMDIESDLKMLEIGFGYAKLGLSLEEGKLKYLNAVQKCLGKQDVKDKENVQ